MCTQSEINKSKNRLRYLYQKHKMQEVKFKETPTEISISEFYSISDALDYELDKYYSNVLFNLKIEENELFLTYLSLKKETVKRNLLSELIKEWEN